MFYYDSDELTDIFRSAKGPIVIFGAGDIGKLVHYALRLRGIRVDYFCDNNHLKWGNPWSGVGILSMEEMVSLGCGAHVLVCANYLESICSSLESAGIQNVYSCTHLLETTDFSKVDFMHPLDIGRKVKLHVLEHAKDVGKIRLKYVDVVVTEACSMKCVDCSNLMQYYESPKHSDLEVLLDSIDRLMQCVTSVSELRVLGGEPFVNKALHRVIRKLVNYSNVTYVIVYTNATLVPSGETLNCLRHPKVILDITNYGPLSRKFDQLIQVLDTNMIAYLTKWPTWTDSGRLHFRSRTTAELKSQFKNCCVNDVLTILNGKLYRCPFSANGTNLGIIPSNEEDVIDLCTGSSDSLREKIIKIHAHQGPLIACSFCNGRDYRTPKIVPAVQTIKPLPLPL